MQKNRYIKTIKIIKTPRRLAAFALTAAMMFYAGGAAQAAGRELVPMGTAVGITLKTPGVVVVGLENLGTKEHPSSPAKAAGVLPGDLIIKLGAEDVSSAEEFLGFISKLNGEKVALTVLRGEKKVQLTIEPEDTENGRKLGLCVRDSVTGVGTMTFYDPESGLFGALGHSINDASTNIIMPLGSGSIMNASVVDVHRGVSGKPGELCGVFDFNQPVGGILSNCFAGIFGKAYPEMLKLDREAIPTAGEDEIKLGKASILCSISGKTVEEYEVEITRIYRNDQACRSLMIKVTDERLINTTGGIVQGMSGSPILQDGKLIGAVTHVLVDDPTRGYGILISTMLDEGERALSMQNAA